MARFTFHVLTLFPNLVEQAASYSILGKAVERGIVAVRTWNIRDFARDRHRTVDDVPYGGGVGMVMKVDVVARCLERVRTECSEDTRAYLLSASGKPFDQKRATEIASEHDVILVCGHYEGVDERVAQYYVDEELSIGDFVLSGGELAALVVIDAVARLLPGVVGNQDSTNEESFSFMGGILEYPQYTRPREFEGHTVPDVLLSGDHAAIAEFRKRAALEKTLRNRPDLLAQLGDERR